ncbi:Ig-like domain repeat protein [Terriglobus albidus]|uniref:Ig-like domain repeat protein n=1 Tax=Terriglobus albidus TaxID=1592106 RepID=UPI0021DF7524|nr:Ig-like domain repeat protein [Terriglobus albidus]
MAQQNRRALPSVTTSLPAGAVVLDAAPASWPLQHISIALKVDDSRQSALAQYLTDLTTKGSSNYHHWLTPQEFAARFGATDAEIGTATTWLEAQGLHVTATNAAHTLLQAASTVATAEGVFHASLGQVELAGTLHVVQRGELSLPGDAPQIIRAVTGLDDLDSSPLASAEAAVDANASGVLVLGDIPAGETDWDLLLKQANAQGITVLGNASGGYESMTVIAPKALNSAMTGTGARPAWQVADGLPTDGLRAVPDFISTEDFSATVNELIARSDGRLGNINATLYQMAVIPGVYTQPEGVVTGAWTPQAGLGAINPAEIIKRWPLGTTVTTTSLLASSYSVNGGTNITFTSAVKSSTNSTTVPTGTVTLTSPQDGVIGSGTIGSDGTVNISISTLVIGPHTITAIYSGDSTFAASSSSPITVTISPSTGTLSASVSPSPGAYGNTATITATVAVTTGTANGTVQAVVNGQTYTGTVASGTGNITITIPPPGKYSIVISCPSANTFVCTNSPVTLSYTATKGNTTTTVTSSNNAATTGDSVTLTATVSNAGNATGTYIYTGNVTFLDGTKTVGTAPLVAGSATATVTLTGAGTHSITAVYSGDTNWNGSTSTAIAVVTSKVTPTLVLSASTMTAVSGTNIVFTATASGGSTTLSPPTGTVTFYDTVGSTVVTLGTATLAPNGTTQSIASVSSTGLLPGSHSLYAIYAGDTNYKSATSNTLAVTISDFTVSLNPTSLNITQGKSAQVAATVTSSGGFAGTITLGCTPPAAALMTCAFSPASLGSSGASTLTITTTANTASLERHDIPWHLPAGGTVLAAIMWFIVPTRRRISLLVAILAVLITITAGGCASGIEQNGTNSSSGGSANNGTPFGTQLLTITVAGTDGGNPVRHNYSYQVTVQ